MTTIGTDPDSTASRLDALKRRFRATLKFDLRGYIASNPWRAVAIGALAGIVLGSLGGHREPAKRRREPTRAKMTEMAFAGFSALAMTLVKELASSQVKSLFERWQAQRSEVPPSPYAG
jgi:hypothetical protein